MKWPVGPLWCAATQAPKSDPMADHIVPHFHNDPGVAVIEIGAREFMCVGAMPPFDHPHIFCDMGGDDEIICSYCSTLYRHDPKLDAHAAALRASTRRMRQPTSCFSTSVASAISASSEATANAAVRWYSL